MSDTFSITASEVSFAQTQGFSNLEFVRKTLSLSEVSFAQTQGFSHRLALVSVSPEGLELDEVRYLSTAFDHLQLSERTASINERWQDYWLIGDEPH